jgi:hypothetical protein
MHRVKLLIRFRIRQVQAAEGNQRPHDIETIAASHRPCTGTRAPVIHHTRRSILVQMCRVRVRIFPPSGAASLAIGLTKGPPNAVNNFLGRESRARTNGGRRQRIHDRSRWRNNFYAPERAFISRNVRVEKGTERGVHCRVRVRQRAVRETPYLRVCACEIRSNAVAFYRET